jgi:hypothetical protein
MIIYCINARLLGLIAASTSLLTRILIAFVYFAGKCEDKTSSVAL